MAQVLALPAFREIQPFRIFLWFCEGVDERQGGECDGVCSPFIRLFQPGPLFTGSDHRSHWRWQAFDGFAVVVRIEEVTQ